MTKEQYKEFENLPSEQLPNDGGYRWHKLINKANERLGKIGRHGKRAKIKGYPKPGEAISIQFTFRDDHPNPQKSVGIGLNLDKINLIEAEKICTLVTSQLMAGTFTWDWFYSLVGKDEKVTKPEKPLTCGEMLEEYKTHFFKQRKNGKNPDKDWGNGYRHIEKTFLKHKDTVINLEIVKKVIGCTENNSVNRRYHLNGLINFLKYFDNSEYKQIIKRYKSENKPKRKDKYVPTDTEIDYIYQTGFKPSKFCPKDKRYRHSQWQFLYSLLAIYGLRIHEAWNIKNWDKAVTLKAGDWVAIDDSKDINGESENGKYSYKHIEQDQVIPAILDPKNEDFLLCIGHETKTGYRVAFPMSSSGVGKNCHWIDKFNIVQPMNLPDVDDPLEYEKNGGSHNCTRAVTRWFNPPANYRKNKHGNMSRKSTLRYGFTAHALRHAYNIRGHKLGVNQKALANSLGHGVLMNSTTYMKYEQTNSKIQGIKQEIVNFSKEQSELEKLRSEIKHLKAENEKLKTKLRMYEAIEPNKPN